MSSRRELRDVPERRAAAAAAAAAPTTGCSDPTARVATRPSLPARRRPVLAPVSPPPQSKQLESDGNLNDLKIFADINVSDSSNFLF